VLKSECTWEEGASSGLPHHYIAASCFAAVHLKPSVARFLGVSASLVNRMANGEEGNDLDEYLKSSL
jgi:hypothetical protein